MPFSNYTLADLAGSLLAVVMFFPVLFVPGYVMGWVTNCFRFRELSPRWRCVISVPVSMAVSPAAIYWFGIFGGWSSVAILFLAYLLYWIWLLTGGSGHERWNTWLRDLQAFPKGIWLTGLAWMVIVLASLVDLQIDHRLYFSATAYDHTVRTAITATIARVGSRPNNPFYYLTGPVPLRYHYFWLLPCGFLNHLAGSLAPARNCMYASAVWCGWGFIALVPTTLRFLLGFRGKRSSSPDLSCLSVYVRHWSGPTSDALSLSLGNRLSRFGVVEQQPDHILVGRGDLGSAPLRGAGHWSDRLPDLRGRT